MASSPTNGQYLQQLNRGGARHQCRSWQWRISTVAAYLPQRNDAASSSNSAGLKHNVARNQR